MNDILFYGGLVLAAAALILGVIYIIVCKRRMAKLRAKMDLEYGEADGRKKTEAAETPVKRI